MNTGDEYRRALDVACREWEALAKQRAELDARIAQLTQSIGSLSRLCGFVPTVPLGLTDACRLALKAAGQPLAAIEVRGQLEAMGMDLSRYSNQLAAVHTILKRLVEAGEAFVVPRHGGRPGYRWKGASLSPPGRRPVAAKRARSSRTG